MKHAIVFATVAVLSAAPAWATTSLSGGVDVGVRARLGNNNQTRSDTMSAAAPTSTSLTADTTATVIDGDSSVTSYATTVGTWTSADAGTIGLDWGWAINAAGFQGGVGAQTNLAYPSNWTYSFVASGNGTFSGTYSVVQTGDTFGLQPLYTTLDWSSGTLGGTVQNGSGSGNFSVALLAGNTYTMSIAQFGNVSYDGGANANGMASGRVDWAINYAGGVPEPASWALMLAGFGGMGAAMRRRRRSVHVTYA